MKRFALVLGLGLAAISLAGCNKPDEESCRKAISNMKSLLGTDSTNSDSGGDVRRCRGASSRKNVECAIAAKSIDELRACGFALKTTPPAGSGSAGSGSAGSGSAK